MPLLANPRFPTAVAGPRVPTSAGQKSLLRVAELMTRVGVLNAVLGLIISLISRTISSGQTLALALGIFMAVTGIHLTGLKFQPFFADNKRRCHWPLPALLRQPSKVARITPGPTASSWPGSLTTRPAGTTWNGPGGPPASCAVLVGGTEAWRVADGRHRCKACGRRTSVTAGTIFQDTRTPLTVWSAAAWYMTSAPHGCAPVPLPLDTPPGPGAVAGYRATRVLRAVGLR